VETLECQITQVMENPPFQQWTGPMSGPLAELPKREVYRTSAPNRAPQHLPKWPLPYSGGRRCHLLVPPPPFHPRPLCLRLSSQHEIWTGHVGFTSQVKRVPEEIQSERRADAQLSE
jgi:hypothetical protein